VRVLILADDPLVAAGLGHLLEEAGDTVAVEDASFADVALVDAGRGGADGAGRGLDALAELPVPALVLVGEEEDAAGALGAGARGALLRTSDPASLWAALVAVRAGLIVVDGAFAPAPLTASTSPSAGAAGRALSGSPTELTAREREVLALLSRGLSNKQIAQRLAISDHTAKFHVNGILGKLGAATRTEAVVIAARQGLVAL
jgi:DNA-binding NarL/FixJ family response regulator